MHLPGHLQCLAGQLESGGPLTNEGEGHPYDTRIKDDCFGGPVDEFLISGTVPEDGLTGPA